MRKVEKKLSNRTLHYWQYGSYIEFLNDIENRTTQNEREETIRDNGYDWTGVRSYDEARNLLLNGWKREVELFKSETKKELDKCDTRKVVKYFDDVCGFAPIVPNAIMGLPNSMINNRVEQKKSKIIKFLIAVNRSCSYGSREIIEKMSKILARIIVLENNGYRCRLEIAGSFSSKYGTKPIVMFSTLIKSENQPIDMTRLAFPIVHSAMQRAIAFNREKHLPGFDNYWSYHESGLGQSLQYWGKEQRQEVLNAINERNEKIIFVGMETDIEKELGEVVLGK